MAAKRVERAYASSFRAKGIVMKSMPKHTLSGNLVKVTVAKAGK